MGGQATFDILLGFLESIGDQMIDPRNGNNKKYEMKDALLSAFSVFFTQNPSFLSYQKAMEIKNGNNNARTIFGVHKIPTDNHIRKLLDSTPPDTTYTGFIGAYNWLYESGRLDEFKSIGDSFLIALDGTDYFYSENIHCQSCSTIHHKDGRTSYKHSAILPVIVKPGNEQVLSLPPEFISPQDGNDKEDCENAAAKRWIARWAKVFGNKGMTLLGDDLYSRQPIIGTALLEGFHFIFVCKPQSHPWLTEYIDNCDPKKDLNEFSFTQKKGKERFLHTYRFINGVPLRDTKDAIMVNWVQLTITDQNNKVVFKNAYCTDHHITKENAPEIVSCGRARWKIENENNNTLKTKGYYLEHNYGHGKKNLSQFLLCLILLSFLFHTVMQLSDPKYRLIRKTLPTRKTFFDDIRALTRYICFKDWNDMLVFMLRGLELEDPGGYA